MWQGVLPACCERCNAYDRRAQRCSLLAEIPRPRTAARSSRCRATSSGCSRGACAPTARTWCTTRSWRSSRRNERPRKSWPPTAAPRSTRASGSRRGPTPPSPATPSAAGPGSLRRARPGGQPREPGEDSPAAQHVLQALERLLSIDPVDYALAVDLLRGEHDAAAWCEKLAVGATSRSANSRHAGARYDKSSSSTTCWNACPTRRAPRSPPGGSRRRTSATTRRSRRRGPRWAIRSSHRRSGGTCTAPGRRRRSSRSARRRRWARPSAALEQPFRHALGIAAPE